VVTWVRCFAPEKPSGGLEVVHAAAQASVAHNEVAAPPGNVALRGRCPCSCTLTEQGATITGLYGRRVVYPTLLAKDPKAVRDRVHGPEPFPLIQSRHFARRRIQPLGKQPAVRLPPD